MASYGTSTTDVINALNSLPNSYAGKILKDIIVDTMKGVTETLTNKTLTSPTITGPTVTGTLTAANITSTGTIDHTGDLDVTGNASVSGAFEGANGVYQKLFTGLTAVEYEANGAIAHNSSLVHINANANAARAYTIDAPVAGEFLHIEQIDTDTNDRVVTLNAGTFDGTNNTATFNAAKEALTLIGLSATRYLLIQNQGSVGLSSE